MNKKTKYATGTFYKLLFLILFLCCTSLNILGVNYPIDSTGVSLIHPSNIVGKSIVFTEPSKSYIANCFYVEEAINHDKYSKNGSYRQMTQEKLLKVSISITRLRC